MTGRPTLRTLEVIQRVLDGLSIGTPLTIICEPNDMPCDDTVRRWEREDPELLSAIAGARARGFDRLALEAKMISDTPLLGVETITKAGGEVEIREGDMLGHRKLQIETRLKLLAKWDPRRYGDRLAHVGGDPSTDPPLQVNHTAIDPGEAYRKLIKGE